MNVVSRLQLRCTRFTNSHIRENESCVIQLFFFRWNFSLHACHWFLSKKLLNFITRGRSIVLSITEERTWCFRTKQSFDSSTAVVTLWPLTLLTSYQRRKEKSSTLVSSESQPSMPNVRALSSGEDKPSALLQPQTLGPQWVDRSSKKRSTARSSGELLSGGQAENSARNSPVGVALGFLWSRDHLDQSVLCSQGHEPPPCRCSLPVCYSCISGVLEEKKAVVGQFLSARTFPHFATLALLSCFRATLLYALWWLYPHI